MEQPARDARLHAVRLVALRASIAAGRYSPAPDAVAEALLGWVVTPAQLDRSRPRESGAGVPMPSVTTDPTPKGPIPEPPAPNASV